jgi:two-component system response regulator YesN
MLLKVMLVDDEPLVRSYIRSLLDWESNGLIICGEAADGNAALVKIGQVKPDIVILDIYMPGLDGVALSKQIAERYPRVKLVALSSYDNYDYVRETLKNGVVDYLLKHRLDAGLLLHTLEKASEIIRDEARKSEQDQRLVREQRIISPILIRNFIKELVLGNKDRVELIHDYFQNLNLYTNKERMIVGVMQINYFDVTICRYHDNHKEQLIKNIIDLCSQSIPNEADGCVTYIEQGRFALLLAFGAGRSEKSLMKRVYEYKSQLQSSLRLFLSLDLTFGFSSVCGKLEDLDWFYQMACRRMEQMTATNNIGNEDARRFTTNSQLTSITLSREKQLVTAVETANRGLADLVLEEVFHGLKSVSPASREAQIIIKELLEIAFKTSQKAGLDPEWLDSRLDVRQWTGFAGVEELKLRLKNFYNTLMDEMSKVKRRNSYSRYVQQALDYIRLHYKEEITLEKTAKEIGITYTYLSKLFKEETGTSFTEYLNQVRIKVSKKFMDSGESVKEIYSNVGFNNYSYFFKVFKELVGLTPLEYMKKKQK